MKKEGGVESFRDRGQGTERMDEKIASSLEAGEHLGVGIDYFIGQKEKEREFTEIIHISKVAY